MLVKYVNEKKQYWEDFLSTCTYAYNTSKHESSKFTPFEVMFARKPILPIDLLYSDANMEAKQFDEVEVFLDHHKQILEAVKSNICIAQQRQKEQYDRKRSCPELFQVGSVVLKKDFRRSKRAGGKLDHRWNGPFKITKCLGRGLYSLERINDSKVVVSRVNGVHLKKYIQSNNV